MKSGDSPANTGDHRFHLISMTNNPLESLLAVWITSRPTEYPAFCKWLQATKGRPIPTAEDVVEALAQPDSGITSEHMEEIFQKVCAMSIPVSECIHLTWGFTGQPIEWREQAVRKRQWGFWLTSMREFPMDNFVDVGRVQMPARWEAKPESDAHKAFNDIMAKVQEGYNRLTELGMTQEEARAIIPLGAKHNGTMFSTLRTWLETTAARSCWIAQADTWGPVIASMVEELKAIHPSMGLMVSPPCLPRYGEDYQGCKFKLINENRVGDIDGYKDPYMPCPLYVHHEHDGWGHGIAGASVEDFWNALVKLHPDREDYATSAHRHLRIYGQMWNRNPITGELKR
jgi:hypothetical protein